MSQHRLSHIGTEKGDQLVEVTFKIDHSEKTFSVYPSEGEAGLKTMNVFDFKGLKNIKEAILLSKTITEALEFIEKEFKRVETLNNQKLKENKK